MGLFGNILRGIGAVGTSLIPGGGLLAPIIMGGIGAAGGALSNTEGARTSRSSSTSTAERTPILPDNVQAYLDSLIGAANDRFATPLSIDDLALDEDKLLGSLNQLDITGRARINALGDAQKSNVSSDLASRGLSFSPGVVSNALATSEAFRSGQLANLSNQVAQNRFDLIRGIEERRANLPILFENLLNDRLRTGASFLSGIPLGSRITTTGEGTNIGAGSAIAGGLQGGLTGYTLGGGLDNLFNYGQTNNTPVEPRVGEAQPLRRS